MVICSTLMQEKKSATCELQLREMYLHKREANLKLKAAQTLAVAFKVQHDDDTKRHKLCVLSADPQRGMQSERIGHHDAL